MSFRRVLLAVGVAVGGFAASMVATEAARGDIKRLAAKYPAVGTTEMAKQLVGSIPLVGGIAAFFASPALDTASESGMTDADRSSLERDHLIVTWAPMAGLAVLVVSIPLGLWFLWTDVIRGPSIQEVGAGAGLATASGLAFVPTPAAQAVAPVVAGASA